MFYLVKFKVEVLSEEAPFLIAIKHMGFSKLGADVQLQYYVPVTHDGLEIMGANSGLSWLKGKSVSAERIDTVDADWALYEASFELSESCEFRARAFKGGEDFWEAGENIKCSLSTDGSLVVDIPEDILDTLELRRSAPIDWVPDVDTAESRIRADKKARNQSQYLVDSIVYVTNWLDRPKVLFLSLHKILRNIRSIIRSKASNTVDELLLPLVKILYEILMEIRSSDETQDPRILPGTFEKRGYADSMLAILDKLTESPYFNPEIELDPEIVQKDEYARMRKLFDYL